MLPLCLDDVRGRGFARPQKGWLLVGLIVLVSAVIIALVGITFFLTEHLRTTSLRQNQTKAIYLAQAGVMQAIYDFRVNAEGNGFTPATYTVGGDVFILEEGSPANFLLANIISAVLNQRNYQGVTKRDRLEQWRLRNVRADTAIQIDLMAFDWPSPTCPPEGVVRIEIANTQVWPPTGQIAAIPYCPGNPAIPITSVSIPAATERSANTIWFATGGAGSPMPGKAFIDVIFQMSDGSTRRARYTLATATRSGSFTVVSSGEVRQGAFPFIMRRRLQAEYRLNDANPTNIQQPGRILSDPSPTANRPGYQELN